MLAQIFRRLKRERHSNARHDCYARAANRTRSNNPTELKQEEEYGAYHPPPAPLGQRLLQPDQVARAKQPRVPRLAAPVFTDDVHPHAGGVDLELVARLLVESLQHRQRAPVHERHAGHVQGGDRHTRRDADAQRARHRARGRGEDGRAPAGLAGDSGGAPPTRAQGLVVRAGAGVALVERELGRRGEATVGIA